MEVTITLPVLHPGQLEAFRTGRKKRVLRCGRRWGKTQYLQALACDAAIKGQNVGWFTPDYKIQSEAWNDIADTLDPIKKSASQTKGVYRTSTGGRIDFWSLDNERAGRSRKYHLAIIDEAAFAKDSMFMTWETAIEPTLLDFGGTVIVASTPNGSNPDNFFWRICNEPKHGFVEYYAPTANNPYMPVAAIEQLRREKPPLVFRQEYEALFVDWNAEAFFKQEDALEAGQPVDYPTRCDAVFAVIDTAVKTGREHDGTAVTFWATSQFHGHRLVLLDWSIVQIEGSLLESWMPQVFATLEQLARQTNARNGSVGAWIEDKASGSVLLQQAARRAWPTRSIDSKLTSLGKDERAINVSGYVYRQMVRLSRPAFEKTMIYKGQSRNHLLTQVFGYRLGVKDQNDDLLDSWCYALALALGDGSGF